MKARAFSFSLLILVWLIAAVLTARALAQESFYRGKTVRIIVGTSAGGGFDTYTRTLARHFGKHIPGQPAIVVENMPGAGHLIGANHMYNVARPDGLTIGHFHGGWFLYQLFKRPGIEFDATKFEFIGSPIAERWTAVAATGTSGLAAYVAPYAADAAQWVARALGGIGTFALQALLTIVIATILYTRGEIAREALTRFGRRLAGDRGQEVVLLAGRAIRAVALGVVVTALVQTTLSAGRYYLHIRNSGAGDPFISTPTGYTSYGSIGQYFISGYVTEAADIIVPPTAELQITDLTESGQTAKEFTVNYSDDMAVDASTIDDNDLRVTGPNGYDQLARLVSVNLTTDGTPRGVSSGVGCTSSGVATMRPPERGPPSPSPARPSKPRARGPRRGSCRGAGR